MNEEMKEAISQIREELDKLEEGADFVCFGMSNESKKSEPFIVCGGSENTMRFVAEVIASLFEAAPKPQLVTVAKRLCEAINTRLESKEEEVQ